MSLPTPDCLNPPWGISDTSGPWSLTHTVPKRSAFDTRNALQFGTVWVNDHGPLVSEMPHGGFKQSGVGKDMSMYAIEAYTELKHVMVKTG